MSKRTAFTSSKIAKEISRVFSSERDTFSVKIPARHTEAVMKFIHKIEDAHQRAKKSKLVFRP